VVGGGVTRLAYHGVDTLKDGDQDDQPLPLQPDVSQGAVSWRT
jgi:hypothetical protein